MAVCVSSIELELAAGALGSWDVSCVNVTSEGEVRLAREARQACGTADLLMVVDEGISPMACIRPGIMPSGLLQRPFQSDLVRDAVEDFVAYVLRRLGGDTGESLVIEGREGIMCIPYSDIICLEAREKRINARTRRDEYAFYDTLGHLEEILPDGFMRCHRGFIVSLSHIRRLSLTQGRVVMDDGAEIPVSRSYRSALKERLRA